MIRNIQEFFKITATLVIGSLTLWNCEAEPDQLGSQFFQNGAKGEETTYPIIAYNVNNGDSIRTDAVRLQNTSIGAFRESEFGLQKAAYVTQLRPSNFAPDFGTNAVLDSVVLVIKPSYAIDSVTTVTDENYIYPIGAVPAKKVVNTYPIAKYGKTKIGGKTIFNFKVEEVTDFLGANSDQVRSNRNVATGVTLGTKSFDGTVNSIKVTKDTDNSVLFEKFAAIRIPLDSVFFTNKILKKGTSPELADAASFIRYFKGIKVSVLENDGYIFPFDPNGLEVNLYYKKDKVENGTTTREQSVFAMNLGVSNAHFSQITFDRAGTPSAAAIAVQDTLNGAPKVYAQGMGGPGIGLKVPESTIATIKSLYQNDKIGIVSAKLRIYTDVDSWSNKFQKPNSFVVKQKVNRTDLSSFLEDISALYLTGLYNLVKAYDLEKNPAYYDIGITQTFKNVVEKGNPRSAHFVLNVGSYNADVAGNLIGAPYPQLGSQYFNTRSFTPQRAVFVGTDLTDLGNGKSAKLILTYGKKQ